MRPLDHPLISERYFFPREVALGSVFWVDVPDARLACRATLPDSGPVLLHFHGNGEVVSDWADDLGPVLHQLGIGTVFAEYRGYGASTGRPMLDTQLDDALAVLDAIGIDPRRVVVYGRSVGSLYALHVAANRPVAGLVLESGIVDVHERLAMRLRPEDIGLDDAAFRGELARRFDHRAKIAAFGGPVLVLHTTHDHLVSVRHGRELAAAAGERGELVEFSRGDHNSIFAYNGQEIVERVVGLVRAVVG